MNKLVHIEETREEPLTKEEIEALGFLKGYQMPKKCKFSKPYFFIWNAKIKENK